MVMEDILPSTILQLDHGGHYMAEKSSPHDDQYIIYTTGGTTDTMAMNI